MEFSINLLVLLLLITCVKCQLHKCSQHDDHFYSLFATKTVYNFVSAKYNYTQPSCKTLQIWLLSRHGTRHPTAEVIEKISNLTYYKNKITENSTLCKEDIDAIKTWNFNLTRLDGSKLNNQGSADLSSLGSRLQYLYKDIFNEPYNTNTFKVLSSPKSRCVDSASYFLTSAFNKNITDIPLMSNLDTKLNIKKFKNINDNDDMTESKVQEVLVFHKSEHMQKLLNRVSKTLGINYNLTLDTVKTMYESCRFDKSWRTKSHPAWCAVFSQQDLKVLEYEEDLKYYYTNGYGDPYNERIGCPIVKDLIMNFRNKSRTHSGPKGVFYFGHSSNVFSAIVRLGFAKDSTTLLSTNFNDTNDRKWKTSYLCPFASNVMAILYECNGAKKVTFFINEVPITIEKYGCILCPWEIIDNMFDPIISNPSCMFNPTSIASSKPKTIIIILLICLFNIF